MAQQWPFPFLSWLKSRRGIAVVAQRPQAAEQAPAAGATVTTTTPDGETVTTTVQEPKLVGTYKSASGVAMDVYLNPNTGRYDVKCPEYPFYDRTGEFRTLEDAKWYIEEVSMGSATEVEAAAATEGVETAAGMSAHEGEYGAGTGMVGRGTTGRYI